MYAYPFQCVLVALAVVVVVVVVGGLLLELFFLALAAPAGAVVTEPGRLPPPPAGMATATGREGIRFDQRQFAQRYSFHVHAIRRCAILYGCSREKAKSLGTKPLCNNSSPKNVVTHAQVKPV